LTSILYLNDAWEEEDGGKLRCYLNCKYGDSSGESATEIIDIEPRGGRLVLFLSKTIPHEVLPITSSTNSKPRMAMSCWFIQSEENEIM
jgi:SM-20-related protein